MKTQKQRIFSILAILSLVTILSFIFVACNSKGDQPSEKPDMEATEIYKSVDPSVAFLLVQKKDGSYASGSGFFIDPHGTLVTNYHVIEDGIKCAVQMKNGNTVEVKTVVSYDEDADLAILATKVANTKPITESKSLPQVGETVYAIGYPEAFKLGIASSTFTSGIVSAYRTMDGNEYIQSTVNITHGNSGGVLINKKGDVVGITSSGITYGDIDYMNLSIPISKIHNLAVESNEPLDVVTARHYPVYATFYAHDLVFDKQELDYENTAHNPGNVQKEGYTFDGWYADKAFTQEWDFSTQITKDTAIFAKLDLIYFSLNLDLNGGVWESNNPGDKYYIKNCEKALPIPKKTGYMFDGWTDSNGNYIDNYPSYSNARALTLTANWVEGTPGLTFQLNDDGTATVTACDKSKSNIVIPTIYRGHKVTSIASSAFADCKSLQSVTISEHVSNIDSYAFDNCTSLRNIVWKPTEKITFGSYVFRNCTNINLIIDDSVTNIADNAFQYQTWFSSITIPDSVTSIGSYAFYNCSGLTRIYYTGDVASWCEISGLRNLMSVSRTLYIGGNKVDGNLTIPDSVTSIGERAFYDCSGLMSVTIPDSVTSIGYSAFSGCTGLSSITIPFVGAKAGVTSSDTYQYPFGYIFGMSSYTGGVATSQPYYSGSTSVKIYDTYYIPSSLKYVTVTCGNILYGAFENCSGLTNVTIGDGVTSIGGSAFSGCSCLTSVTIPDSVTSIGSSAFYNTAWRNNQPDGLVYAGKVAYEYKGTMPSNTSIVIKDGTFGIAGSAFKNCSGLTSVTIPDSVTSIGDSAFYGCSGLTSVTIPDSVTSIGDSTFYGCSGLTSVTIPDSVTSIGDSAFYGCSGLTSIYYTGNVASWCGISGLRNLMRTSITLYIGGNKVDGNLTIPDSVTSIGDYAFYGCSDLASVTIGNSVTSIGSNAFYGTAWYYNQQEGVVYAGKVAYEYKGTMPSYTSIVLKEGTLGIGDWAFSGCTGLTSITIPDSVTSIGDWAFSGCTGLTSITIPDSVTSIGDYAFRDCTRLTSMTIGNSVTSIGNWAFENCKNLQNIYITDIAAWCNISGLDNLMGYGSSNKRLYINNELVTSVSIPNGVTKIPSDAFRYCRNLTSITIPDSVTKIGGASFSGCNGLTSIVIPDSVTSIGGSAFYGCTGLTSVVIPDSVTSIGEYAFYGCTGLTSVTIGNSVTSIGYKAFYNCSGLTSVIIGNGVTSIGDSAFYGCTGLTSVTIGNSVTIIGACAFYDCSGLTSITIPDSVTSIGASAFSGCTGLTSVTIGNSVTSIGYKAFHNCSGLTSITIPNSVTSIDSDAFYGCYKLIEVYNKSSLKITAGSSYNGDVAYYAKNVYTNEGGSKLTTDENGYVIYTDGDEKILVSYHGTNTELVLPSYITKINKNAFRGCTGLTSVTIPDSVTSIGASAFSGCSGLTSVTISNSVTSIGSDAFRDCYKLIEVYNKSSLKITAGSSYNGDVAYYAKNVYTNEGGSKLTTDENGYVIYTDGDEKILVSYHGTNTELILPSDITKINQYIFYGCTGLTSVVIPDSVTSIDEYAFYGCTGLTSVTIGNSVTSIGEYAFRGCTGLTSITIPDSVTIIGDSAFNGCTGLTSIIIPDSVTSIGEYAFFGCSGLTSVTIPDSVTSIGLGAFKGCIGLTSMTLPFVGASETASNGYDQVFGYIFGYTTTEKGTSVSGATYQYYDRTQKYSNYYYYIPSSIRSVIIIGGNIPSYAFRECTGLTSITIQNSVTSIGKWTFFGCSGLTSITFNGTIAQWNAIPKGSDWEYNVPSYCKVYCTDGTISI